MDENKDDLKITSYTVLEVLCRSSGGRHWIVSV